MFSYQHKVLPISGLVWVPPSLISEISIPGPMDEETNVFLQTKKEMLAQLKDNLHKAQNRMKKYAELSAN